jgi:hypothetical protein
VNGYDTVLIAKDAFGLGYTPPLGLVEFGRYQTLVNLMVTRCQLRRLILR